MAFISVLLLLCFPFAVCPADAVSMWAEPLQKGVGEVQLAYCRNTVENGFQLMQLRDHNSLVLVSWVKGGSKCEAPGPYFAACLVDEAVSVVTLKVVVTDLQDGETRNFFCRAGYVHAEGLVYRDSNISVTYTESTVHAATTVGAMRLPLDLEMAAKREPEAVPSWPLLWAGLIGCGFMLVLILVNVLLACLCRKQRPHRDPELGENEEGVAAASATRTKSRVHGNPLYEFLSSNNKPRGSDLPQGHSTHQTERHTQPPANYEEIRF